jgi:hypothetical protein
MACDRMRGDFPCLKQQLNADGTCIKCNCLLDEHPEGHCQTNEPAVQDVSTSMGSLKRGTELKFCCVGYCFHFLSYQLFVNDPIVSFRFLHHTAIQYSTR